MVALLKRLRAGAGALFVCFFFGLAAMAGAARAADVSQLNASDPMSWLVKSVCTDSTNRVLPVDPYGGCPSGAGIRKIQSGDPLPYHNVDQSGVQQRDVYPVLNPIDGNTWLIANYDWQPFDLFNLYNGTDGYDVYQLQGSWASIVNTSDGGGYGQTFYGSNCTVGGAWVLFPTSGFLNGGSAMVPIKDVYWEQTGQSYPGGCPTSYSTDTETSWQLQNAFEFGGVDGNPVKTMETMVSYHGFRPNPGFLTTGQMEVDYFTREYGITRWEVWTPIEQNPVATTQCIVPATEVYQGVTFVVQSCHDWSAVTPSATAALPVWPIPNINLLANAHFEGNIKPAWTALGKLSWSTAISTAARDTANGIGVAYLTAACGTNCSGFANALYQDVPVGSLLSGNYDFGVSARSEAVNGVSTSGTIGVEIEQLGPSGRVLSSASTIAAVSTDNGTAPSPGEYQSVYLSTSFVNKQTNLMLNPQTVTVRFLIAPQSPNVKFDVLDAWFAAWPVPTGFGAL
jgi:hypothetical protein